MSYKLFLDDVRTAPDGWITARNFDEFTAIILERGTPDEISFDNDLGEKLEGYDCAKWLAANNVRPAKYKIHSANPVARDNIEAFMELYLNYER